MSLSSGCCDLNGDVTLLLQVPIHQCLPWEGQWVRAWPQGTFSSGESLPAQDRRRIRLQEAGAQAMPEGCQAQGQSQ